MLFVTKFGPVECLEVVKAYFRDLAHAGSQMFDVGVDCCTKLICQNGEGLWIFFFQQQHAKRLDTTFVHDFPLDKLRHYLV